MLFFLKDPDTGVFFCRIHDQIEDGAHKNKLKNARKRRWNDEYFVIIRRNPVCIAMMSDLIFCFQALMWIERVTVFRTPLSVSKTN